jgi:glycosyltransferase involved in cell wall biosynthesis
MRICMVTSHIPPYQSANAILPQLLASKLKEDGHQVSFIIPEKALKGVPNRKIDYAASIIHVPQRKKGIASVIKIDSLLAFISIYKQVKSALKGVDIVHIHSNGLLHQTTAIAARKSNIPIIITHYGTEIWHYKKKKLLFFDLFKYMNDIAVFVTYYSKMLMEYSFKVGIVPKNPITIYPPAGDEFKIMNDLERKALRKELGIETSNMLVNVKRLHPLGGHEFLIRAMPDILQKNPDTKLYICGKGELYDDLEKLINSLNLQGKVELLGMVSNEIIWKYYAAADLYVLSSVLEALPTVVIEALACGTPVVMTNTPGGKELLDLFPEDIRLVELHNPEQISQAVTEFLSYKRRIKRTTSDVIYRLFRTEHIYKQYLNLYKRAVEGMLNEDN